MVVIFMMVILMMNEFVKTHMVQGERTADGINYEEYRTYDNSKVTKTVEETVEDSATSQGHDFAENAFFVMALFAGLGIPLVGGSAIKLDYV